MAGRKKGKGRRNGQRESALARYLATRDLVISNIAQTPSIFILIDRLPLTFCILDWMHRKLKSDFIGAKIQCCDRLDIEYPFSQSASIFLIPAKK